MAITNFTQTIILNSPAIPPNPGDTWISGTSKAARKIGEQNLPADYTLTQIQVNCTAISGATGANPAIIRVYQYGRENSAATIELSGVGIHLQTINLLISANYGADRKVIIDAWDPDTGSPNNSCSLKGTVAVAGRPYFSSSGGTNQEFN